MPWIKKRKKNVFYIYDLLSALWRVCYRQQQQQQQHDAYLHRDRLEEHL